MRVRPFPPRTAASFLAVVALVMAGCTDGGDSDQSAAPDESSAPAPAERRLVTLDGVDTDAPDDLDRVQVLQEGSPDAPNVVILSPGTSAGAGYFDPIANEITTRLPDWQVWSVERRENLLEDHSLMADYQAGTATAEEAFDYYLGWITDPSVDPHFEAPTDDEVGFARDWGMEVAVGDLRAVVDEAAALGGLVILGGHSLGGTITTAYASWDFDGTAGAETLDGLVFIDGGSAAGAAPTPEEVRTELAGLATGPPFNDLVGLGLPWAAGVFNALGSGAARQEPDAPNLAYDWPPFPADLKPPVAPSNAGQYGYALDVDTSPPSLALVHLSMGSLAASGDPRGFDDDPRLPVARAATVFAPLDDLPDVDGTAWYHPQRLTIDGGTVNGGLADDAQEVTGVRAIHGDELDLPIFALETGFGAGRVLAAARALADQSGIDEGRLTLVEAHDLTHTDPMALVPEENPLIQSLVPFLESLG